MEVVVQTFKVLKKFIAINIPLQNFNIGLNSGIWVQIEIDFFFFGFVRINKGTSFQKYLPLILGQNFMLVYLGHNTQIVLEIY